MKNKLRDQDSDVRLAALDALIGIALENPCDLQCETFKEMSSRCGDKKLDIRRASSTGLARIYCRHVSSVVPSIEDIQESQMEISSCIRSEIISRLSFIPYFVLQMWGFPDAEQRHHIIQVTFSLFL